MNIKRIDSYTDNRFSKTVLNQHGAYLIDNKPYEIEIISLDSAIVRGVDTEIYNDLIEEFRFHAPHIKKFYNVQNTLIKEYSQENIIDIYLKDIQPSQFYVSEDKLKAISSFIHDTKDIIIQVIPYKNRYISLDGHTRLYYAFKKGYEKVKAVISESDDYIWTFVKEAERRNIIEPKDMILLPHDEYLFKWDKYCDEVFENIKHD